MIGLAVAGAAHAQTTFRDASATCGITFRHTDGSSGQRYIMETIASGLGLIDYDNDGYLDIYFLNGAPLRGTPAPATPPTNALYRNNGDGTFTDVTEKSGAGDPGYALGCAVADYDNDGDEDIYITNYGPNVLLRNNGDGTFTDVTQEAGVGDPSFGAGCSFLDYNRDGYVDLYSDNYLVFKYEDFKPCSRTGVPVYCDPRTYPPVPDILYRNNGDGTFTDVSMESGIGQYRGYGMGMVCSDFDLDGWTDIYVGNDVQENFLFHNKGDGTFEEIGLLAGVAYDLNGDEQGTMGVNAGDYDGDGWFDIIATDYQNQMSTLYRNVGGLQFQDVTLITGAGAGTLPLVTWACGFPDVDNDGVRELFQAAGHLQDSVEQYDQSTTYKERNLLFKLQKNGTYLDITEQSGEAMLVVKSSRGAVFGDLDNDGDIDTVVQNPRDTPTLMINECKNGNHWILVKLVGTKSNRSAIGALAYVTAGGKTQIDEVRSGRSYQSAEDLRLHFGLGKSTVIDRIEIRWPSGMVDVLTNMPADQIVTIVEGSSPAKP
jgi:hypothetical protein